MFKPLPIIRPTAGLFIIDLERLIVKEDGMKSKRRTKTGKGGYYVN